TCCSAAICSSIDSGLQIDRPARMKLAPPAESSARASCPLGAFAPRGGPFERTSGKSLRSSTTSTPVALSTLTTLIGSSCPLSASFAPDADRGDPDRTPLGAADASRACPVPPRRRDEGGSRAVLHRDRRRDSAAPAGAALHPEAVSPWDRRPCVLPQASA